MANVTTKDPHLEFRSIFLIEKKEDSHCAMIWSGNTLVKIVAGDLFNNNTETNVIDKAIKWVDKYVRKVKSLRKHQIP